ncbi:MAG: hypothetical protein ChlgKO_12240 [Chlamydiales bacterium]
MSNIEGQNPEEMKAYQQDFQQSIGIFRESLEAYTKTDKSFYAKQETLKESMGESKQVMDQLTPLFGKEIQKQKAQFDQDYDAFSKEDTPQNALKLQEDLNGIESSFK